MLLTFNADNNSDMNVDRIHCNDFSYSDSDINDYIHSAFHLNFDMRNAHTSEFNSHIACFQVNDNLSTGFDCFDLIFNLIVLML